MVDHDDDGHGCWGAVVGLVVIPVWSSLPVLFVLFVLLLRAIPSSVLITKSRSGKKEEIT